MISIQSLERVCKGIAKQVSTALESAGVMHRIFTRIKTPESITKKNNIKRYDTSDKMLQDAIGIRIILYFNDDVDLLVKFMKKQFEFDNESVSKPAVHEFSATNKNIVFRIPALLTDEFNSSFHGFNFIDSTFEVQIRTIFSEGWHEVEHDLRYKYIADWDEHKDLSRMLNGIFASLLSSEWAMEKLFLDVSYRHYKDKNWNAMVRNKFRVRCSYSPLSESVTSILNAEPALAKQLFRANRSRVIEALYFGGFMLPMNLNNLVYLTNYIELHSESLSRLTPPPLLFEFKENNYLNNY